MNEFFEEEFMISKEVVVDPEMFHVVRYVLLPIRSDTDMCGDIGNLHEELIGKFKKFLNTPVTDWKQFSLKELPKILDSQKMESPSPYYNSQVIIGEKLKEISREENQVIYQLAHFPVLSSTIEGKFLIKETHSCCSESQNPYLFKIDQDSYEVFNINGFNKNEICQLSLDLNSGILTAIWNSWIPEEITVNYKYDI